MYETRCQSRFDARYWMHGARALGRPRGMVWGGRREVGHLVHYHFVILECTDIHWSLSMGRDKAILVFLMLCFFHCRLAHNHSLSLIQML